MADFIPIAELRGRLLAGYDGKVFSYVRVWSDASSGQMPGVSRIANRWLIDTSYIPAIAAFYKLTAKVPVKRAKQKVAA